MYIITQYLQSLNQFDKVNSITTATIPVIKLNINPEDLRLALEEKNIESRWIWRPMHMQPVFNNAPYYGGICAEDIYNNGLCLPSGSNLTDDDIQRTADAIIDFFTQRK